MRRWKKVVISSVLALTMATGGLCIGLIGGNGESGKDSSDIIDPTPVANEQIETKFENYSVKGDDSYVSVGELWDNDTRTFNKDNIRILLRYMGLENATLDEVTTKAGEKLRASDMRSVVISAGVQGDTGYTAKKSNQNINVMLGGIEWTVCYLSNDKTGNPVLTLMMSNSIQDAFAGRSQTEGEHYGYLTDENGTSLYSDYAYNWYLNNTNVNYPNAMYGTSYVRAVTLNNGGKYALSGGNTLSDEVEQDSNSAFAIFTMSENGDGKDLTDYITTPSEMLWQENQSAKTLAGASYNFPNDAWSIQDDEGFYTGNEGQNYNYSTKENYDTWKNDKLWLPSMSETGWSTSGTQGMWGLNVYQKMNYDGKTVTPGGTVGTAKGTAYAYRWLRSGGYNYAYIAFLLYPSGASNSGGSVDVSSAICPSLHLTLNSAVPRTAPREIQFETNGGNEVGSITRDEGEAYGILPTPEKEGKYFGGWYIDSILTQEVSKSTIISAGATPITLYAKWLDEGYSISYFEQIKDGETYQTPVALSDSELPKNLGTTVTSSLKTLTKQGYIFKGWKFTNLASGASVTISGETKTANTTDFYLNPNGGHIYITSLGTSGSTVTATAVWERDKDAQLVTYKTYADYFTDNNISTDTMNNLSLSQSTLTDAEVESYKKQNYDLVICNNKTYYILTQKGFMYLTNNSLSKISLANKNLELYCDIILNEEYFDNDGKVICDKDGKPTRGDGIVYSWKPMTGFTGTFNGHNHTIYGYYYNNPESSYTSFFGPLVVKELKNLKMQNVFVRVASGYGIMAYMVENTENCHVLGGHMIAASGSSAGVVYQVRKSLTNCSNYASIEGGGALSGIFVNMHSGTTIDGAENYGNITGGWAVGGILANTAPARAILKNCKNYGTLLGTSHIGGIAGIVYNASTINWDLINCENYGEIKTLSGGNCAGMIAYFEGDWNLIGCKNYGRIGGYGGTLTTSMVVTKIQSTNLYVKDCYSYSTITRAAIYNTSANSHVYIDGLEIDHNIDGNFTSGIIQSVNATSEVNVQNISLKVICKQYNCRLFNRVNNAKNIFADIDCTSISTYADYLCGNTGYYANGVILNIHTATKSVKQYYGSSFRDFYLDWRTDKIGLSSIDGVGTFQGRIAEEWLKEKGFVKKD